MEEDDAALAVVQLPNELADKRFHFTAQMAARLYEDDLNLIRTWTARKPDWPGYVHRNFVKGYTSPPPTGFPKESASCPDVQTGACNDATALEVELTAPANAQGLSFDFDFFTFEFPQYICSQYNDFFVAILEPFPAMQTDGNRLGMS